MPQNVEIKAKVQDVQKITSMAEKLSGSTGIVIVQEDTFFNAPNGRLKLRVLEGAPAQLIFYERLDVNGPKLSQYFISETQTPESLKDTLKYALGIIGEVRKRRMLYMIGQTRVHIDHVEGLGDYMELESILEMGTWHLEPLSGKPPREPIVG